MVRPVTGQRREDLKPPRFQTDPLPLTGQGRTGFVLLFCNGIYSAAFGLASASLTAPSHMRLVLLWFQSA
jgi:hypothetical protein